VHPRHFDADDKVLRGLLNGPDQRLWLQKDRSVGHKNCMEAIIEQSMLMHPSATLLLGTTSSFIVHSVLAYPVTRTTTTDQGQATRPPLDVTRGPAHIHALESNVTPLSWGLPDIEDSCFAL
jgi:hypothetical protein